MEDESESSSYHNWCSCGRKSKKPKSAQGQDARITGYEDEHCAPAVGEERSEHVRVLEVAKQV